MNHKRLGTVIIIFVLLLGGIIYVTNNQLTKLREDSCIYSQSCDASHESPILVHTGIAITFTLFGLGLYLLFFRKSEGKIIEKIERDSKLKSSEEKFKFILMGLNKDERKILSAIKEQDGITQQTLKIRVNMHKSKLSVLIKILEDKELIKKVKTGKYNKLFLRVKL